MFKRKNCNTVGVGGGEVELGTHNSVLAVVLVML